MPTSVRSSTMRAGVTAARPVMEGDDLADLPLDRMQRIERRHRLLEHHGDGVAAHGAQFVIRHFEHVAAAEKDLAAWIARGGLRQETDDRLGGDGLAGARIRRPAPACGPFQVERRRDRQLCGARRSARRRSRARAHREAVRPRSQERLSRIESVAHRLADENEEREHQRRHDEGGKPDPGRRQVGFALQQEFAERRRAGRHAEA